MSTCSGPPDGICAGAAATAAPMDATGWGAEGAASGSRINAPSPLPNAFLAIGDNLLCKIDVGFRPSTMNVVEMDRLAMAGCFRQANVAGDDGLEHLGTEEISQVCGHLLR